MVVILDSFAQITVFKAHCVHKYIEVYSASFVRAFFHQIYFLWWDLNRL